MCKPNIHKTGPLCETWNGTSWSDGSDGSKCPVGKAANAARPKGADGSGLADDKERQIILRIVKAAGVAPANYKGSKMGRPTALPLLINSPRAFSFAVNEIADGLWKAQSDTTVEPSKSSLRALEEIYAALMNEPVWDRTVVGKPTGTRTAPVKARQKDLGSLTLEQLLVIAAAQGWACFYCKTIFGSWLVEKNGKLKQVRATHDHVQPKTLPDREPGDVAACQICNPAKKNNYFDTVEETKRQFSLFLKKHLDENYRLATAEDGLAYFKKKYQSMPGIERLTLGRTNENPIVTVSTKVA